jgi:quinol monooxygenase YgiN
MLIRIVKMTFRPEETSNFLELFNQIKEKIRDVEGCDYLELMEDYDDPDSFSTYSKWHNEQALADYRESELFDGVWAKTKAMFAKKPIAFSLKTHTKVD